MSIINNIFSSDKKKISPEKKFWTWFEKNNKNFSKSVKNGKNMETDFFDLLIPELDKINDGIYFLAGMKDEKTTELIFTADGVIKNIVFVEELVSAAPKISNWQFTALKPELEIENVLVEYENKFTFSSENLFFTPINHVDYPDEIDILIHYDDFQENDENAITNGVYIFLDNYLGELTSVTSIDNLNVQGKAEENIETIPIAKLKEYLLWREREFTQKFQNIRRTNTDQDSYASFEAKLSNNLPYLAIANTSVLKWEDSPSHPWILKFEIEYNGTDNNGLPNDNDYNLLNDFEEELMKLLIDYDGYINVGRETGDNLRQLYFACQEFRYPSKVANEISKKYNTNFVIDYNIFKDKYWRTFDRFRI